MQSIFATLLKKTPKNFFKKKKEVIRKKRYFQTRCIQKKIYHCFPPPESGFGDSLRLKNRREMKPPRETSSDPIFPILLKQIFL